MIKNPTPRGLAVRTAAGTALIVLLLLALLYGLGWMEVHPGWIPTVALVVFGVGYAVQLSALERFIYRKIKVIYKNISERKSPKGSVKGRMDLDRDILGEVEQEVLEWARGQTREIEQLQAMAEYRKEFLGNVSHELKTPIFSIQGYIDTLIDGGLYDERINLEYLHKASHNIERMIAIVRDLENISLLESGQLRLEMSVFNVCELAREVMGSLEEQADAADMELGFKPGINPSVMVRADRDRVRQVLVNFLTNAIRYGREGGYARIGVYDMSDRILVEVSDNGIGIAPESLGRVFERFFRTDKARSRERGGTGLGLSIAKHIVEAHGMGVNVRSTENVGSTFGFTLPKP
jgi:two-component system phosphate regulon sensor histidine kinase PhoR